MKSVWKNGLWFALMLFLLIGCSSEPESKSEKKEKEQKTEVAEKEKETETEAEPESTADPEQAEPAEPTANDDVAAYGETLASNLEEWSKVLIDFSQYNMNGSNDPDYMMSDQFITDGKVHIDKMNALIKEARSIQPPADAAHIQDKYLEAMDHFEFVAQNYLPAVEKMDFDLIMQCVDRLNQAGLAIGDVSQLIVEYMTVQ